MSVFIKDGMAIVGYLDDTLSKIKSSNATATGIVIGTLARKRLTDVCQSMLGQPVKDDITVNRFRGVLLIEDGNSLDRIEVIHAVAPVMPVEGNPFKQGLRKVQ